MSPRTAVLIETGPSGFDVRGVVVMEREGLLITAFCPPLLGAMEAAGGACQPCEGSSRDTAWAQRTSPDQTPPDIPRLRETPSKNYPR